MFLRISVFVAASLLIAAAAAEPQDYGIWIEPDSGFQVKVYPCAHDDSLLCGLIVEVPPEKAQNDVNNPSPNLRDRRLQGLEILTDFAPVGPMQWEGGGKQGELPGRIYLPPSGDTLGDHRNRYRVEIERDRLVIKIANCRLLGCISKSVWRRVDS